MQWGSFGEFLAMGGYGLYVWTSFIATGLCMAWEVLALWRRRSAAAAEHPEGFLGDAYETAP